MAEQARPRIAVAGMAIESSTYSPHRAGRRDFVVREGDAVLARYDDSGAPLPAGADWVGTMDARSIPGGAVEPAVYDELRDRICARLREAGPVDGVFLDLHGAMSVAGRDDAEGDLVAAVRDVVGPAVPIAASMDLHGNLSRRYVEQVDLVTCYRLAPHEDAWETRQRAAATLLRVLTEAITPVRAWVRVPVLLPGEKTSTRVEPARSLYARVPEVAARPGVLDAAIWVGYAWADEPRCHATVVVQGTEEAACETGARELAEALWEVRRDFVFVGPPGTLVEAVDAALAAPAEQRPYVISDSGDNPGAGGTGDVTWTLTRLLADERLTGPDAPLTLVASIFDAAAFAELRRARVGGLVDVVAGARTTPSPAPPVRIHGTLVGRHEDDPDAGGVAVIAVGGLRVILTEHRKAFHDVADFTALGLDPEAADIVVTKIGYLEPTLHDLARGWTLALTPGGVDQDLERLGHHRIERPMFPYDDPDDVDLSPVLLRGHGGA